MRRSLGLLMLVTGCGNSPHSASSDLAGALLHDLSSSSARDMASSSSRDLASSASGDLATATLTDLAVAGPYPAGPYGNTVGAVIPMLSWEGYSDPLADAVASSKTYGNYSMNDLRLSGRPYAAIHVAEFF